MNNPSSQGDEQEFVAKLQEAQARLYGYIHMLVRDVDDADDVFQQTMLILWRKYHEYDQERSFFSWACGIARFEALNFLRKHQRQVVRMSEEVDLLLVQSLNLVRADEYDQRKEALSQCVKRLKEADQSLLREHYALGKSVKQIAEQLERTPQSVHNSFQRVRAALLKCVKSGVLQKAH